MLVWNFSENSSDLVAGPFPKILTRSTCHLCFFLILNFVFEYQEMLGPGALQATGHVLGVLI